jgi:predicted TIM-barrel fold metal-dependent hydrolase
VNNYFSQLNQKYPERAFFMANVALSVATTPDRVEFCINELRRAIEELGLHSVCIPTNIAGRPLSDPMLEPFFKEVERLDIPLYIHPESPYCIEKLMNYGLFGRIGFPNDQALMIGNLIYSQNPDSGLNFIDHHPKLKIILTHLGGGLPYFFARLDLLPMFPHLKKLPSEYLKDFYFDTAIGNSLALEFLIKFLGSADRIMFGTDHPYVDSAEINTIDFIEDTCLTKKERKKIYFKNAESLFVLGNKKNGARKESGS